jgi:hypothetical protein
MPMTDQPEGGDRNKPYLTGKAKGRKDQLRERQAEEMRKNLRRRKQQQRERAERER